MLGHAIEYLTDELTLECMAGQTEKVGASPRIASIELLKMLNREVYLECPVVVPFQERLVSWMLRLVGEQRALRPAMLQVTRRIR